jgi:hypothetical protein
LHLRQLSAGFKQTGRTRMIDPEHLPLWLKILLFPPMLIGASLAYLPFAKTRKWRAVQIGCAIYFFLFANFFVWKSIIGYAAVAVAFFGLSVFLFLRRKYPA